MMEEIETCTRTILDFYRLKKKKKLYFYNIYTELCHDQTSHIFSLLNLFLSLHILSSYLFAFLHFNVVLALLSGARWTEVLL